MMNDNPQKIQGALKKYSSCVISTHVNPDPDALCSELAVALYLKTLGKKVRIINAEPLPGRYAFLPASRLIGHALPGRMSKVEAAVVVDCGDLERTGDVKPLVESAQCLINIDHHITNTSFGRINCVVPGASSTAEVIYDLLKAWGFPLDKRLATLLYLGIMTDTGCFRYENTTARTHEAAGHLLRFGFSVSALYRRLYETIPPKDVRMFAGVVRRYDLILKGRVVVLGLSLSTMKKFSEEFDLRDKVFRYLRAIRGVEVAVIFTQGKGRTTRVNLRSQGKYDVAALASVFGGGGHHGASGCILSCGMKAAREKVVARLKRTMP